MKPVGRTPGQIAVDIVRLEQAGEGFRAPAMRAAAQGLLGLYMLRDGNRVAPAWLDAPGPKLAILLDDCPEATGPGGWPQAVKLLRWSRMVILHATAGEPKHYYAAALSARLTERALLVECEERHHAAWLALARREMRHPKVVSFLPAPGTSHPNRSAPDGVVVH